jgi:two-component system NtrC family sensor kinase
VSQVAVRAGAGVDTSPGRPPPPLRRWPLIASMLAAIAVATGLAWWDEQREAQAALRDLEVEQSTLASSLAGSLEARLIAVEREGVGREGKAHDPALDPGAGAGGLLDRGQAIERAGELTILLSLPGQSSFRAMDGRELSSPPLRDALDRGLSSLRLGRPQSAQLGLPARTAMAGLARVDAGPLGRWGVVAVASAARERDREKRAERRLVLGVVVVAGLVVAFGGAALRKQRQELELARELAVARAQRVRDEALARAARIATTGTFAMGIAHEVSSPLGVIVGRAEQLLGRVQGDARAARGAQVILEQAQRIEQIVRRFLDMARGGPPVLEQAGPGEVAVAAAGAVEHRFVTASVSLATTIPAQVSAVRCDRALLEHALVNLLLNACDACGAGGRVELAVRCEADHVAFVVTDDGVGITQEHAARAAEPFFTTKPEGSGTGLGLAIASEIAKGHRGELTIAPHGPRGTRACIEIPTALQGASVRNAG